jgi:NADH-quinone oxidoreductase subunit H
LTPQVPFLTFLIITVVKLLVVFVITLTAVAYTVLLERKIIGRMQNRWGPSRTGPFGLLQPLADGIKLFLKEDMMPLAVARPLFIIAPMIALVCAMVSISVVPFGALTLVKGVDIFQVANVNIALLVILGITSIGVYGIALSGWSSNNKFALLGSLRATSQMISYELALGLSLVGVVLRSGSLTALYPGTSSAASRSSPSSSTSSAPMPKPIALPSIFPRPNPSWSPVTTLSTRR